MDKEKLFFILDSNKQCKTTYFSPTTTEVRADPFPPLFYKKILYPQQNNLLFRFLKDIS